MFKKIAGSALLNNKYFTYCILPCLFVIIVTLIYGSVYYEENDDFFLSILLKGDLQPQGGFQEISYWGYRYLLYAYSFLYTHFPSLPWYGIFLYIFNAAAAINIFVVLNKSLSEHFNRLTSTVFLLLILFIVNIENIILINFTRTAILLAGSSLLVLFILLTESKHGLNKIYIILCSILFTIAFFIRPIAVLMITFLMLPFILYIGFKLRKSKFTFYFLGLFFVFTLFLYFLSNSFIPDYENDIKTYYEPIANIMDFGHEDPGQLLSKQDSIKREAIRYVFYTDRKQISNEYLARISSSDYASIDKSILPRLDVSFRHIMQYLYKDYPGMTLLYVLLVITLIYSGFRKHKVDLIFLTLILLVFFSFLMIINTMTKLPERLFVPFYCMFAVSNIYLLKFSNLNFDIKKKTKILSAFLLLSFGLAIYCFSGNYKAVKIQSKENYETFFTLERQYSKTTFLITLQSSLILGSLQPMKDLPLGTNKILPVGGYTTIMPSYYRELESICGSTGINDFFNYIKDRQDYLIISDNKFNDFLTRYFRTLYNNEIQFVLEANTPDILKRRNLFLYKITL